MARLLYSSSSDDEFPALQIVAKRVRQQRSAAVLPEPSVTDKENVPMSGAKAIGRGTERRAPTVPLSRATPLRRRKLGEPQLLDNPLLRKWSGEAAEPISESSRASSREIKSKPPALSRRSSTESDEESDKSDEDVFVRTRRPAKAVVQNPCRSRTKSLVKTEALVSVIERKDETKTIEETMEISAITLDGDEASSTDEESEFVTALSEGAESDSNYESPLEFEPRTITKRPRSANSNRPSTSQPPVLKDPLRKNNHVGQTSRAQDSVQRAEAGEDFITPRTPEAGSRKASVTAINLGDDFQKLKLYADELDDSPESKPRAKLDPVTPRKTLQPSPFKAPIIPPSPWKAEHNEFWDVQIQNEWIDQHSPPKRIPKKPGPIVGAEAKVLLKQKYGSSPEKRGAKKAFEQEKEKLAQDFLHELDERITSQHLSELTAATGGLRIKWSSSLQTTAGRAHWKCKEVTAMIQQADGTFQSTKERRHEGWIELASKVLNNEDDLLNTVAHEFCHLAVFMLNGKPKFAHGAEFKHWGQKCESAFKGRGIVVTTKHNYEIDFKFIWRCVDCVGEVKRHSKSVNPEKQRCGKCHGILEQVKPVPRATGKGTGKTAYQEFVSQQMKVIKAEGKGLSFKEMMAIVSTRWKTQQQARKDNSATSGLQGLEEELRDLAVTDPV
jgi:predicted SprT family Zn-dependent metalloprotease